MSATTGTFNLGDISVSMPVKAGTIGPSVVDISKLYAQTGMFTYDPGSPRPRAANPRSPISTATKASCSIAAIRSRSSPSTAIISRPATFCSTANCRRRRRRRISTTGSRGTPWCMSRWPGFSRACAATPIRWPLWCERRRSLRLLSRFDRYFGSKAAHGRVISPYRQNADDRGHGL